MEIRIQIRSGGRLIVPVKMRKALNIQAGDEVLVRLEADSIRLIPLRQAVNLAQEVVKKYVPSGRSLVDELIEARRSEARRE